MGFGMVGFGELFFYNSLDESFVDLVFLFYGDFFLVFDG